MCFEYDGYNEFTNDKVITAKKPHRCTECRSPIESGEKYHYHTGKYDGDFFAHKICRRCDYDVIRVVEHELEEGCHHSEAWPPFGGLVEHLIESGMGQTRPEDVPESFQVGDGPKSPVKA